MCSFEYADFEEYGCYLGGGNTSKGWTFISVTLEKWLSI